MYVLLTVAKNLFIDFELFRIIVSILVTSILLWANIEMEPCNVKEINTIRSAGYTFIIFSAVISIWAFYEPPSYRFPLIIYCIGFVVVIIGTILVMSGYFKRKREIAQASLVKAFTDSAYQPLLDEN